MAEKTTQETIDGALTTTTSVLTVTDRILGTIEALAKGAASGGITGTAGAALVEILPLVRLGLRVGSEGISILQGLRSGQVDYDNLTPDQIMARVAPTWAEQLAAARVRAGLPPE